MTIQFGKPNYNNNGSNNQQSERQVFFKLGHKDPKQRTLVVRIAPPIGELSQSGIWARYIKQHFGYTIKFTNRSGETKSVPMTFKCIEQTDRNNNVLQPCPECEEIRRQKEELEKKTKRLEAEGKSKEEVKTATHYLKAWLKDHNLDKKWHLVAKNTAGQWGFLTISHSAWKLLKGNPSAPGLIDNLVAKNIDPLSPDKGVWFRFVRNGTDFNEIRDIPEVEKETVTVNGETLERVKFDSFTQADLAALEKLPSLDSLGRTLTFDQIKMLVTSGGDEETVRTVMNMPRPAAGGAKVATDDNDEPESDAASYSPPAAAASAPKTVEPAPAAEEDDEIVKLKAALAAATAKKAATATPSPQQPPKASLPAAMVSPKLQQELDTDMESFLAKYK